MLTLVTNVILLETKEEGEPIKEVHVGEPLGERRFAEVADGAQCSSSGSYLREVGRRAFDEEVVDGDDVERPRRSSRWHRAIL